jgi:hypothetical protein
MKSISPVAESHGRLIIIAEKTHNENIQTNVQAPTRTWNFRQNKLSAVANGFIKHQKLIKLRTFPSGNRWCALITCWKSEPKRLVMARKKSFNVIVGKFYFLLSDASQ